MRDLIDDFKTTSFYKKLYKYRYWIITIIIIFLIMFSWVGGSCFPNKNVVGKLVKDIENRIDKETEMQIEMLNDTINNLEKRYYDSIKREQSLNKTISQLKKDKENVQIPQSVKEIKDLSSDLGYPPI